jgi:RNA polymerase sigma factor (sigma-70 family)
MATDQPDKVIGQLRRAALPRADADLTDGQLLERFVANRDGAALDGLVRRHGPMVFGVCRRVLRDPHDADDAFQATFLVLLRKAASVVPRQLVANWLYGVAVRTAQRARMAAVKRRARETPMSVMPEPAAAEPADRHDLLPQLDLELSRLPDRYRVPIVLCELEGKTHQEAARQVGCPVGTLSGRLSRGRQMLARRLARRGMALSVGSLAAWLSEQASSSTVPPALVAAAVRGTGVVVGGPAAAGGVPSATAAKLAEEVLRTMLLTKLRVIAGLLTVGALGVGVAGSGLLHRTQAAEQADARKEGPAKAQLPAEGREVAGRTGAPHGDAGLDERKLIRIAATTDGKVEKIHKATGEQVKKGETLADLTSPDVRVTAQNLLDAQRNGNAELQRVVRERFRLWGVDDDQVDQILKIGQPTDRLTIRSPVAGRVVRTHRIRGDQVKAGDPLYDVAEVSAADPPEKAAAERSAEPVKVQGLRKERLATLRELVRATRAAYQAGKATFAEVADADAQLLKAELEMCESDKERLSLYEKAVGMAIECEKDATQRYRAGQATQASVLAATVNRLEAEIAYERAKARLTRPAK